MTLVELHEMIPLLILGGAVVPLLLTVSFYRNLKLTVALTVLIFIAAFTSLFFAPKPVRTDGSLLSMDGYALFYIGLFLAASLVVALLSYGYVRERKDDCQEFYILLILATLGASVLAAANSFIPLFLGLEILSVSLYVLISYLRGFTRCIEAGVKYLILAAASSAFLLFGIALFYAECGTMDFKGISEILQIQGMPTPLLYAAFGLLFVGFGFKLAIVPFHMWTPDVYEGAPSPVTAYIATVSKGAVFSLLVRFFFIMGAHQYKKLLFLFSAIAVASMFTGNLLALRQENVKRVLAYSSIAHLGYLLVAFIAGGDLAVEAAAFYLVSYFITTLAAFGVVAALSGGERDADSIEDYRGLFWQRPWLAAALTAALLSLAGIPLTAGFLAKYYLVAAGMKARLWALVIILIINSAISIYYYLRIVAVMYAEPDAGQNAGRTAFSSSPAAGVALCVMTLLLVWIGVYPQTLITIINAVINYAYPF
ncbi:MAG: NADH-quinone oxidoreductase subunit N [Spirochaetes bacterium RBG_16_49_21]|nr:MAG: NADH-quinone oxidoreductase subunit N [Spirochaetes bacterium RBG_16_49_21]